MSDWSESPRLPLFSFFPSFVLSYLEAYLYLNVRFIYDELNQQLNFFKDINVVFVFI